MYLVIAEKNPQWLSTLFEQLCTWFVFLLMENVKKTCPINRETHSTFIIVQSNSLIYAFGRSVFHRSLLNFDCCAIVRVNHIIVYWSCSRVLRLVPIAICLELFFPAVPASASKSVSTSAHCSEDEFYLSIPFNRKWLHLHMKMTIEQSL